MRCPTLKELPPPPVGKFDWPWTAESLQVSESMPNGLLWPKFSIVTPSFNQGQFIEETIRSVLLQGYPNLEYIIIDGGSTDNSVDVIKKYSRWISFWVSEPDNGQAHAINKGFLRASGTKCAFLNSDDVYEKNAIKHVSEAFACNQKTKLVVGECTVFSGRETKRHIKPWWPEDLSYFVKKTFSSTFAQPSAFWDKNIFFQVGKLEETLNFCFDREYFLRLGLSGVVPVIVPKILSRFREHDESKTVNQAISFHQESIRILTKYAKRFEFSDQMVKTISNRMANEINYIKIFKKWKSAGRFAAAVDFYNLIVKCPSLLLERKILGLARRLLSFKENDVQELKSI